MSINQHNLLEESGVRPAPMQKSLNRNQKTLRGVSKLALLRRSQARPDSLSILRFTESI